MSGRTDWRLALAASLLWAAAFAAAPRPDAAAAQPEKKAAQDDAAALRAAAALYEGVRVETLDNGLRVFLKPVPGSAVVTTMVCYKVGSSDEDLDHTGLSHYLEHLMFKGTEKIKPGDIDRVTLRNGGQNNAYTSEDLTNFHFDFAADRWEAALEIEADRMRNLRIDKAHEFEEEKGAVISELMRNEDEPWDLEQKAILPLLFGKATPYGHPVIGETEHVKAATDKIIKAHYDKWYHPNNASLVIVGGFDPDKAMEKVKKLFGPIPKGKLPERKKVEPVKLERPARKEFESKFEVARMVMGFNTVPMSHADYPALSVLESALGSGKTGRLYKTLIEGEELCSSVNANNSAGRYPGWFGVYAEVLRGKDRAKVEQVVLRELKKLRDEPISEAELKRAQRGILASTVFGRESVHGLADSIAQGVTVADLDFLKNYLPRVLAVTAKDVQRVAKTYFDEEKRVTVWSVPPKGDKGEKGGAPSERGARNAERGTNKAEGKAGTFSLKDAQRVELPNGIVLLLFEDHRLPIVTAQAELRHVSAHEPEDKIGVAALMGSLLDEGTAKTPGPKIAELIEDVGGALSLGSGGGSVKVLSPDRSLGLSLLFECLTQPAFPKDAFFRNKAKQLSAIAEQEAQPASKARREFLAAVYGKHPKGRPGMGTHKSVEQLTRQDCVDFYKKVFVPNNLTVAVVGDFNSKDLIEEIKKLTADWKKTDLPESKFPAVDKPKEFTQKIITMDEAVQLQFYMGHVGVTRKNPDYYKLLVMDYVLGTGPGFTDRLSARLRDREGLAYTVNANISSSADLEPGVFSCYIGTEPKNFDRVKKEFLEELNRIRDKPAEKEEVEDAKQYLLGSLPFQTTTGAGIATQLLYVERYGLGLNYLDDYRKAVSAVTVADVQEVAKKYIDPKRLVLVAAGAVDKEGKELKKAPPKDDK
jgi:zinc protease